MINSRPILLTGFEAFGKVDDNPSKRIVDQIAFHGEPHLVTTVLPVEYKRAGETLRMLIDIHQPAAILMLGIAQNRDALNLERVALNINDAHLPDNAGELGLGRVIEPEAPAAYWSTLPLDDFHAALTEQGIPVRYSNHAGAYLCNHVFFVARHLLEITQQAQIPCGFIHIPAEGDTPPALPLETMIKAVDLCLDILAKQMWEK